MTLWKHVARDARGAEIAEAAIVLPLVFMLLLGIYWFGRAYNIYATITYAAREGARAATASSSATLGNTVLTPDQVAARVSQALQASKLNPNQVTPLLPSPALRDCTTKAPVAACAAIGGGRNNTILAAAPAALVPTVFSLPPAMVTPARSGDTVWKDPPMTEGNPDELGWR